MTSVRAIRAAVALQWRAAPAASACALALAIVSGAVAAVAPWLLKLLLDELETHGDRVVAIALAGVALACLADVALHLAQYASSVIHARIGLHVDRTLFEAVGAIPGLAPFEQPKFHRELRLAQDAAHGAPAQLAELAQGILRTAVAVGSLAVVVAVIWPPMAALLLAVGGCGIVAQLLRSRADAGALDEHTHRRRWRESYRALLVDVRAAKELRLFGAGPLLLRRMLAAGAATDAIELRRERRALVLQLAVSAASLALTALGVVIVVRRAVAGTLVLGDVALFLAAVAGIRATVGGVIAQLGYAANLVAMFQGYLTVVGRPVPPQPTGELAPLRDAIELRDVWFRYDAGGPWVLRGVNLVLPRGQALGLVGLNGAGKTTLIKLLAGFYDLERGQILWDGVDIRRVAPAALRARIAATFQDFMTYDLTAADNIALGDHPPAEVQRAAHDAGIAARIAALPDGFATQLSRTLAGEDGDPDAVGAVLSGGEWQRVALARALLRRSADLLILDEPNAGLDARAEREVHEALVRHAPGTTRLLVSHRLNALREADVIAVLRDGVIAERGTHDELIAARGDYAQLFALQAEGYRDAVAMPGGAR